MGTGLATVGGLFAPLVMWACINDSDTDRESRQMPPVIQVVTGRFERNPPLYYEMRRDRAEEQVGADPTDWGAYDDAATACDRLGLGDEAIAWMERKREALETEGVEPAAGDGPWYRYHANVGTFWVHRWFRDGADRSRIGEVQTARDHIARAIELYPAAHGGREGYQLRALGWIVAPPEVGPSGELPTILDGPDGEPPAEESVEALAGLVALGNAWESVDIFHALTRALERRDGPWVAAFARLRCDELIDAGRGSILPGAPMGAALKERLNNPLGRLPWKEMRRAMVAYHDLRASADAWHARRMGYMEARLEAGRHPNTDPAFWDDFHDPGPPPVMVPKPASGLSRLRRWLGVISPIPVAVGVLVGLDLIRRLFRRRRPAPKAAVLE